MDNKEIMDDFRQYLENEKKSSLNTVESYARDIRDYLSVLRKPLSEINNTDVISYIIEIENDGKSKATVVRKIASLRCFFQFLLNSGEIRKDPTSNIKAPRVDRKKPEVLSYGEVEKLLNAPDLNTIKGIRDKAILELMYGCGLKPGEISELKLEDINIDLEYIKLGDFSNERYIPLGKTAKRDLDEYLKYGRHTMEKDDEKTIFLNLRGKKLTRQGIWKIVKHYSQISGIEKNINPLTLRHSFATHMVENGASISSLQEFLGHIDISTTQIYEMEKKGKLKEIYKKTHPRAE